MSRMIMALLGQIAPGASRPSAPIAEDDAFTVVAGTGPWEFALWRNDDVFGGPGKYAITSDSGPGTATIDTDTGVLTLTEAGDDDFTLEPVDPTISTADRIAITVGTTEQQTWECYGWGVGSAADAATVAPLIAGSSTRTQALFADLATKVLRLNNPQQSGFVANCKPLTDYAATQGVDRILATGYVWQNINGGGSFTPTLLADAVHAAISGGIPITHVTLQNEPDGGPGNGPPGGYAAVLRAHHIELRNRLNTLGRTSVKVLGLEWAHFDALSNGAVDEYAVLSGAPENLVANGTVAHGAGHIYADGPATDVYNDRWGSTPAGRVAGIWSCETGTASSPAAQARAASGLNNGTSAEIFHQGHADAHDTPGSFDDSQKLLRLDGAKQSWWGGMSVLFRDLPRGSIFYHCTSGDRPTGLAVGPATHMYRRDQGSLGSPSGQFYPRIQMAAARRPDNSWVILGVNSTDGAGSLGPNNLAACYPAATLQITVTMPVLSGSSMSFTTRRASKAGTITSGTLDMVNGVIRFTVEPGETISLVGSP